MMGMPTPLYTFLSVCTWLQQPAAEVTPWTPEVLARQAERLRAVVDGGLVNKFLDAAEGLPNVAPRTIWVDRERRRAYSESGYEALPEEEREGFTDRRCDAEFYYCTGYGSPLIYARPLEILGGQGGLGSLRGRRVLDFGHGMIGQLRMMATMGAEAHGVDVNPMLPALYDREDDLGPFAGGGLVRLHTGRWPCEPRMVEEIGSGYDVLLSKNVLKRGYIHPSRPAEPRMLIDLGDSDEHFLKAAHDALNPGGLFLIYNLCPPKSRTDQPYIPWAEGECPFSRDACTAAGFEIIGFDVVDDAGIHRVLAAIDGGGAEASELEGQIFAWYTLLRRRP